MPFVGACGYRLDELWTIGVIVSAMLYGGLLALTLSYIPLLLKTSYDISRCMRNFLLVYVTIMIILSTAAIITTIVTLIYTMVFGGSNHGLDQNCMIDEELVMVQSGMLYILCAVFASWGADGFMIWRCAVLYKGVSRPRRIALIAVLSFMALVPLGCCIAVFIIPPRGIIDPREFVLFMIIASVTVALNLVTATLITLRILYFGKYTRRMTVGLECNGSYMALMSICVESSALIVVFNLVYIILYLTTDGPPLILMQTLVHIYVLSPLLIVYRVAQGKAATIRQRPSDSGPTVSVLYFAPQQPPPSSNNIV